MQFVPLDKNRSTLIICSRPNYGKSDFGVNETRIWMWLSAL